LEFHGTSMGLGCFLNAERKCKQTVDTKGKIIKISCGLVDPEIICFPLGPD
jgi:hypothetical protein